MKTIYKIAKTELQTLFYSPVAWLILIIFTLQVGMSFMNRCSETATSMETWGAVSSITHNLFVGMYSLFYAVYNNLYLYIPLLTMGLMSREFGSGSINLLYSSPVTNWQIILGKYLSMLIYGLILMAILTVFVIFGTFAIKDADTGMIWAGMLGIYLLICTYSAIGLFMSSLTSYQIVAAIGTLSVLSVLNFINELWQGVDFVRDITYWLSISGRTQEFIGGFIQSVDILYFVIVSLLFLSLTIIRLQARRQKIAKSVVYGRYVAVIFIAILLGYISSRPKMMLYCDTTQTKSNTLTSNSLAVVSQLKGGLTITTYNNLLDGTNWTVLPHRELTDIARFRQYTRFKPEIKLRYVYYYDDAGQNYIKQNNPGKTDKEIATRMAKGMGVNFKKLLSPEEAQKMAPLASENNRFVRVIERENGEKTFLRFYDDGRGHPEEGEITAALKRLVMKLPMVGFVSGHGERDCRLDGDADYQTFTQARPYRYALINQGFDFTTITLDQEVSADIDILVLSDMRTTFTPEQLVNLDKYIARGGNLYIAVEPRRGDVMQPLLDRFGVGLESGCLVHPHSGYSPDLVLFQPTEDATKLTFHFQDMINGGRGVLMSGAVGLKYNGNSDYKTYPLLVTNSDSVWNEMETIDFANDTVLYHPQAGEIQKQYVTAIAQTRQVNGKEQKIVIVGDADCLSNLELSIYRKGFLAANYKFAVASFFWLSDGQAPVDVRRPALPDNKFKLTSDEVFLYRIGFIGVLPALMLLFALLIWFRRRAR